MTQPGAPKLISIAIKAGTGLGAVAIALAIYGGLVATKSKPETVKGEPTLMLVDVIPATTAQVTRTWEGFGTARPMNSADVSAQVTARVVERGEHIEPGNRVEKGDVLVRLDPIDFEQRLESALQLVASIDADLAAISIEEARLAERVELAREELGVRQREYERATRALEEGAGNVTEVEVRLAVVQRSEGEMIALQQQSDLIAPRRARLNAQLASANADLRLAEENLDRTEIRSPISGTIQSVTPEVGELLTAGQAVARVVDLSRLEVPLRLPASCVTDIAPGALVTLRPDGPSPAQWQGNVARIAPESDPATRMVTVFVEVQQSDNAFGGNLLPGRFVVGSVRSAHAASHVIIPRSAVKRGRVTVVSGIAGGYQIARMSVDVSFYVDLARPEIDPDETQWAVIKAGLSEGDKVVLGTRELTPGQRVRIQSSQTARAEGSSAQGGE